MITNVNIRACENGFFMNYHSDGKSHDRVFASWDELCDWLKGQVAGIPSTKK